MWFIKKKSIVTFLYDVRNTITRNLCDYLAEESLLNITIFKASLYNL